MPQYRFTTSIDGEIDDAEEAIRYETEKEATDAAQASLVDMARDKLPNGKRAEFVAIVEDDERTVVYRAKLTLHAQDRADIEAEAPAREDASDDLKQALSYGSTPHRAS